MKSDSKQEDIINAHPQDEEGQPLIHREGKEEFSEIKEDKSKDESQLSDEFLERKRLFIRKYYPYIAILSGLLFGIQLFLYEVVSDKVNASGNAKFSLYFPWFIGYFSFYVAYYIKEMIYSKYKRGFFWSREASSYFSVVDVAPLQDQSYGGVNQSAENRTKKIQLNKFNIYCILVKGVFVTLGTFLKIGVLYTATLAGLNYSLVTNIYGIVPFLVAVIFYLIFKERLHPFHIYGIVVLCICIVFTSLGSTSSSDTSGYSLNAIVPIMIAIAFSLDQAMNSSVTRFMTKNTSMSIQQMTADAYLFNALALFIGFLVTSYAYTKEVVWAMGGISVIAALAFYALSEAVAFGKGGPSCALHQIQSLFALILEMIFLHKIPTIFQYIGFFLGFFGSFLIAFEARKETYKKEHPLEQQENNDK